MDQELCLIRGCKQDVQYRFQRVLGKGQIETTHYCIEHGDDFLRSYSTAQHIGKGQSKSGEYGVAFEVEMVLYDYRPHGPCNFFLRESGGTRQMDFVTGPFEAAALGYELGGSCSTRPRTHRAMYSLITELGGRLARVTIEGFPDDSRIFAATLHILGNNDIIPIDLRPSDAVVLAVVANAPIYVSHDLLKRT